MRLLPYQQILSKEDKSHVEQYAKSLCDPWNNPAKIPLGFPVKSTCTQLVYRIPISILSTALNIGGTSYTLTLAGNAVAFWFNPNKFDSAFMFNSSCTNGAQTLFANWNANGTSKGYVSQMASFRLVSAGIRFVYTGAALYAKGQVFANSGNARDQTDYGTSGTGYTNFITDPDTVIYPIVAGLQVQRTYMPIDLDSMSFIATNITDSNMQDWSAFIAIDGYDSVNGISGYFDMSINYECIPSGVYEQLIGPSINPGGSEEDAKAGIDLAKKEQEYQRSRPGPNMEIKKPTEEQFIRDALDWFKRYNNLI
ncbi:MAG: hypothetical protein KA802_16675 [Saprospiraceae bacterium]|nr:hypothetical protein [Saprospiraceae bacterium]